jgi:hypothetical protein
MDLSKPFSGEPRKDFESLIEGDDLIMRLPEDNGKIEGYRKIVRMVPCCTLPFGLIYSERSSILRNRAWNYRALVP